MFVRQRAFIRTISLLTVFSVPINFRVFFQRKRVQLFPLLVAGFSTLIFILVFITLTSLPRESIFFIPDLPALACYITTSSYTGDVILVPRNCTHVSPLAVIFLACLLLLLYALIFFSCHSPFFYFQIFFSLASVQQTRPRIIQSTIITFKVIRSIAATFNYAAFPGRPFHDALHNVFAAYRR